MSDIELTRRQALAGIAAAGGYLVLQDDDQTAGVTLPESDPRAETLRPVIGGTWLSADVTDGYGTLGVGGDFDGEPVALTNRHVVDESSDDDPEDVVGNTVFQPDEDIIGEVIEASDIGGQGSEDWAVVGLDTDRTTRTIGTETVGDPATIETGDRVVLDGARTGLLGATVERTSVDTNFRGELYSGLIEYQVDENRETGGNSGCLVGTVENGTLRPIGLHTFGIDEWRYAIPWSAIPDEFSIVSDDTEPPTPHAGGWIEGVITDHSTDTVTVHVANIGGDLDETTVVVTDSAGTELDSADVTLDSLETTTLTLSVGDETTVTLEAGQTAITTELP